MCYLPGPMSTRRRKCRCLDVNFHDDEPCRCLHVHFQGTVNLHQFKMPVSRNSSLAACLVDDDHGGGIRSAVEEVRDVSRVSDP